MDSSQVKPAEQLFLEKLVKNFGYILLIFFLLLSQIILHTVIIVARILHLETVCATLWAWIYPSKFARKSCSAWRFISHHVTPLGALVTLGALGSTPIVIGSTLEDHGPELELLWLQIKALARSYLPAFGFLVGILFTYGVLRLQRGYNESSARINKKPHAPRSIVEQLDPEQIPGEFPVISSRKSSDDLGDVLMAKDKEIATLREKAKKEDQEHADLTAKKDKEISSQQTALEEKDKKISYLQFQADRKPRRRNVPLARPRSYLKEFRDQVNALEGQLSQSEHDFATAEQSLVQNSQRISELERQLSQRGPDAKYARHSLELEECNQRVIKLEAQLEAQSFQRQLEATNSQQLIFQRDQRISELDAQNSQHKLDAADAEKSLSQYVQQGSSLEAQLRQHNLDAQQSTILSSQQFSDIQAKLSQCRLDLASAQEANATLQNQLSQDQFALAEMTIVHDGSAERLVYLESQCAKANIMYRDFMQLRDDHKKLCDAQSGNQYNAGVQYQAKFLQAELHTARAQIAGLSKSNQELEKKVKNSGSSTALLEDRLSYMDKEVAEAKENSQMLQEHLDSLRDTGKEGSQFQKLHETVQRERDEWYAKANKLQGKVYVMEAKLADLQKRETSLDFQLKQFKNNSPRRGGPMNALLTSSTQGPARKPKVLKDVEDERDAYKKQLSEFNQVLEAALASVEWQLEGRSEEETDQKCKDLGEDLGPRLKPVLDGVRWQTVRRCFAPNKRKAEETVEEEEGEEERGPKRPYRG